MRYSNPVGPSPPNWRLRGRSQDGICQSVATQGAGETANQGQAGHGTPRIGGSSGCWKRRIDSQAWEPRPPPPRTQVQRDTNGKGPIVMQLMICATSCPYSSTEPRRRTPLSSVPGATVLKTVPYFRTF